MNLNYGYVRVSSRDQNYDRQIMAMKENGIKESNIYADKQSGKDFDRPHYIEMITRLKLGDCIFVLSIDRLGRNYEDIQYQWKYIVKERMADIVVIDMPILDTRVGKDLIGTFLSDIVLQVLSFVAENERNNIKKRQAEGIAAAKLRGVQFGRPRKPLPNGFEIYAQKYIAGEISAKNAAKSVGMSVSSFYRRIGEISGNGR